MSGCAVKRKTPTENGWGFVLVGQSQPPREPPRQQRGDQQEADKYRQHRQQHGSCIMHSADLRTCDQEYHHGQQRHWPPAQPLAPDGPFRDGLDPTLGECGSHKGHADQHQRGGQHFFSLDCGTEISCWQHQPQVSRQEQQLQQQVERGDRDSPRGVALAELGEGNEPVGAGHQQNQQHAEVQCRVVGQCMQRQPNEQRDENEVTEQDREDEAGIAECIAHVQQRHLYEGGVEQRGQHRPQQGLEARPDAGCECAQRQAANDGGQVDPDLVAFEAQTVHRLRTK